jgi:hypothetical protein
MHSSNACQPDCTTYYSATTYHRESVACAGHNSRHGKPNMNFNLPKEQDCTIIADGSNAWVESHQAHAFRVLVCLLAELKSRHKHSRSPWILPGSNKACIQSPDVSRKSPVYRKKLQTRGASLRQRVADARRIPAPCRCQPEPYQAHVIRCRPLIKSRNHVRITL